MKASEVFLSAMLVAALVVGLFAVVSGRNERATAYARGYAAAVDSVRGRAPTPTTLPAPEAGSQFWLGYVAAQHQLFAWTRGSDGIWPGSVVSDSLMREGYAQFNDGPR